MVGDHGIRDPAPPDRRRRARSSASVISMTTSSIRSRSLHHNSTTSQPSRRNIRFRRMSRARSAGVAWNWTLWHSTPTCSSTQARSRSASLRPDASRTVHSSTSSIPEALNTCLAKRWNQLRGRGLPIRSASMRIISDGPGTPRPRHRSKFCCNQSGDRPWRSTESKACPARFPSAARWINVTGCVVTGMPSRTWRSAADNRRERRTTTAFGTTTRVPWGTTISTVATSRNPSSSCRRAADAPDSSAEPSTHNVAAIAL
ncbi:MAG: hypothetical protein JWL72_1511 [Ilumatobacteraceae bacterium]|nr:hypothetical protein [Ilumatobacteraceae bacterium]